MRFARHGDPTTAGRAIWPAYAEATDRHLEFGDVIRAGAGLEEEACDLFDGISGP